MSEAGTEGAAGAGGAGKRKPPGVTALTKASVVMMISITKTLALRRRLWLSVRLSHGSALHAGGTVDRRRQGRHW